MRLIIGWQNIRVCPWWDCRDLTVTAMAGGCGSAHHTGGQLIAAVLIRLTNQRTSLAMFKLHYCPH